MGYIQLINILKRYDIIKGAIGYSIYKWSLIFIFGVIFIWFMDITSINNNNFDNYMKLLNFSINLESATEIFLNNLKVILILSLGAFLLGTITISNLVFNSFQFGMLVGYSIKVGSSAKDIVLLTLPHGIIELPALWLTVAAGLKGPQAFLLCHCFIYLYSERR